MKNTLRYPFFNGLEARAPPQCRLRRAASLRTAVVGGNLKPTFRTGLRLGYGRIVAWTRQGDLVPASFGTSTAKSIERGARWRCAESRQRNAQMPSGRPRALGRVPIIESLFSVVRQKLHNVKNWGSRNANRRMQWIAAAIRHHKKRMRKLRGVQHQDTLIRALGIKVDEQRISA